MQSQLEPTCKTHWTHVPKCLKIEILCHTAMSKRHVYWKPFSLALAATIQQDLPNLLLLFSYSVVSNSFVTPMDCSPPGFSVHGISQARILERVATSFTRRLSWPGIKATSLFFFFFSFIFISWRLITLQYCSGFCHTLTWISHGFTCVPHPDPTSLASPALTSGFFTSAPPGEAPFPTYYLPK